MPVYDSRNDVVWPDYGEEELPPWEFRIPDCVVRPDLNREMI